MTSKTRSRARLPGDKEFGHDVWVRDTLGFEIVVERTHGGAGEEQQGHEPHALARRLPARDADGMANAVAKLVALITPKRRCGECYLSPALLAAGRTELC